MVSLKNQEATEIARLRVNSSRDQGVLHNTKEKTRSQTFKRLLLSTKSPLDLVESFMGYTRRPRQSDAQGIDFSFQSCARRMFKGYQILMFSYSSCEPIRAKISADGYGLMVEGPKRPSVCIPYQDFRGIILGDLSLTFESYKNKCGKLSKLGLDSTDCFTLVTEYRGLDFASPSDRVKYDTYIVVNLFISALNSFSVPLNKQQLTLVKVKFKLRDLAHRMFINLKELFLLAIASTLIQLNEHEDKILTVLNILDRSVRGPAKIHRLCTYFMPSDHRMSEKFALQYNNIRRIAILNRRMAFALFRRSVDLTHRADCWKQVENRSMVFSMDTIKRLLSRKIKFK